MVLFSAVSCFMLVAGFRVEQSLYFVIEHRYIETSQNFLLSVETDTGKVARG